MAIEDLLARQDKIRKGPPCTVCELLGMLPDAEASALTRLLSNPTLRYSVIGQHLRGEGYDIADQTLSRHARGLCDAKTRLR